MLTPPRPTKVFGLWLRDQWRRQDWVGDVARAPGFVAERIGALALGGDADGVSTWKRVEQLGGLGKARLKRRQ